MKKAAIFIITVTAILSATLMIISGKNPEFFDIFGLFIFLFLFISGLFLLKYDKKTPDWLAFAIILIGTLGLIVDGIMILKAYLN